MKVRQLIVAALLLCGGTVWAASDYLMEGGDPGRSGWMKGDTSFTTANVKGMKLLWKVKLDSPPRELHNLHAPLIVQNVATPQGPREIALVAGVQDRLFAIDPTNGSVIWQREFDSTYVPAPNARVGDVLCPGGQTAVPVIGPGPAAGQYIVYAVSWDGRLRQVNLADGKDAAPPEKFIPSNGKVYALTLQNGVIYTGTAQGCGGVTNGFYTFDLATRKASMFTPGAGGLWGRRGVGLSPEGVAYLGSGDGNFNPSERLLGTTIVGVKVDANKQVQLADYFAASNANWLWRRDLDTNVTPLVFDHRGRKFVIATSKECRLWLLDRDNFGGDDHRTTLHTTPLICNDAQAFDAKGVWGALTSWEDATGTRFVAVPFWGPVSTEFKAPVEHGRPTNGGVAVLKLEEKAGKWQLTPAWLSGDMDMADTAIAINGVLFAFANGAEQSQVVTERAWNEPGGGLVGGGLSSGTARRLPMSRRAVLYALDAATGQQLWSSGTELATWNHFSGITVANGRAYIGTHDGMLYAFGVAR